MPKNKKNLPKIPSSKILEEPNSCCVKNCDEYFKYRIREFEKFPKSKEKRKKWMEILGLEKVTNRTRICDKHFTNKDYNLNLRLNSTSAPSLYLDIVLENPVEIKSETSFEQFEIQEVFVKQEEEVADHCEDQILDSIADKSPNVPQNNCRICLKEEDIMINLFDPHETEETVAGLYQYCTGLEAAENDKFPKNICKDCFSKLEEAWNIKKVAIESHFILKSQLEIENQQDLKIYQDFNEEPIDANPEISKMENPLEETKPKVAVKRKRTRIRVTTKKQKPTFYCDICDQDIDSHKETHMREHRKQGANPNIECKTCEKTFYLTVDLQKHTCEQLVKECEQCKIIFYFAHELKNHLKEEHLKDNIYTCPEENCNENVTGAANAYYHIRWHKYKIEHFCDSCGLKFDSQLKFTIHRNRKHLQQVIPRICDLCGISIKSKQNLNRHMKTVHLKMRVNCDVCFRDFFDSMTLRLHKMREHLENTTETSYKCGTCNKIFLFKSQYNFHLKTSHKITRIRSKVRRTSFPCDICKQVFSQQANLIRHRKGIHENIRNYCCEVCAKRFTQNTQLQTHMRIHTGEKPFKCQHCDVRYSDRSTLWKHLKSKHKDEKPSSSSSNTATAD